MVYNLANVIILKADKMDWANPVAWANPCESNSMLIRSDDPTVNAQAPVKTQTNKRRIRRSRG